jgi:hypothetical protein
VDDLKILAEFGRDLDREPPATLVRQRNRLLAAVAGAQAPRRRLSRRPLLAGTAAVLVAGAALAVALPSGRTAAPAPVAAPSSAVGPTIDASLAGWSVQTEADGSSLVTLKELTDATALRQALAAAHVPARVWLVPTKVADPQTFEALSTPIVGCPVDYVQMKQYMIKGIPGLSFSDTSEPGTIFSVNPSKLPGGTVLNLVVYTLGGVEDGYYISVSKSTENACSEVG